MRNRHNNHYCCCSLTNPKSSTISRITTLSRPSSSSSSSNTTLRKSISYAIISLLLSLITAWFLLLYNHNMHITTTTSYEIIVKQPNTPNHHHQLKQQQKQNDKSTKTIRLYNNRNNNNNDDIVKDNNNNINNTLFYTNITLLPNWIQEYIIYHNNIIKQITKENWKNYKYIIVRCIITDRTCGGISDRLKSLPTILLLSAISKRIILYYWTKPTIIENFYIPYSINWSVPIDFIPTSGKGTRLYTKLSTLIKATTITNSTIPVLCVRIQDQHGGSVYYNQHPYNNHIKRAFRNVFRNLFYTIFQPTNRIYKQYESIITKKQLQSKQYVIAHVRANYGNNPIPDNKIIPTAINAIHCVSQLRTSTHQKILFLSDSNKAIHGIENTFKKNKNNNNIITLSNITMNNNNSSSNNHNEPLHLDKDIASSINEYDSIFIDLLLFSQSICVSHGQGGFGRLGVLLSYNSSCFFTYIQNAHFIECNNNNNNWKDI